MHVGRTVAGRYNLVRLLGDGGMGSVYKAADPILRRFVAIKLLHPAVASNPKSVERFQREARAAAAIGHPNIVDILDFGWEDDAPFLVMEYLRGRSLARLISSEEKLDIERACKIATHTLAGLAAAHDRGILHRDLKPANLMLVAHLGDRDFVKILDFGFAALLTPQERIADDGKHLTPARTLVGTPTYAAPERLRGDDRRDPRIDVYSVGVLLFEMLAGQRPFDATTFAELARKVRSEPPPGIRTLRADCPRALDRVISRALAKEPEERWDNAEMFAAALVPFGGRILALGDDMPSDSFTMDLIRIRERETLLRRSTGTGPRAQIAAPQDDLHIPIEVATPEGDPLRSTDPTRGVPDAYDVPTAPTERSVAGACVVAVLRFVARRFGERAMPGFLASLDPSVRPIFDRGIGPDDDVPLDALTALYDHIDTAFGHGDLHLVVDCGRAAAEGVIDRLRSSEAAGAAPPELLVAELPRIARRLFRGIEWQAKRVGRGYGRLELHDPGTHSLSFCVSTLGFLDRALANAGAEQPEVTLTGCRALGDEACVLELSWMA